MVRCQITTLSVILLAITLPISAFAQPAPTSQVTYQQIKHWNDSLRTLQAPDLIPGKYSMWRKHFERVSSEYTRDSTSSSFRNRAQQCAREFAELEPQAFAAFFFADVDRAMNQAKAAGAKRYAPTTLSRAETYRTQALTTIRNNRQNLRQARLERSRAEYEARHALALAKQIEPLAEQKLGCEQLALNAERQLYGLGVSLGLQLGFANGSDSAVSELHKALTALKVQQQTEQDKMHAVDSALQQIFADIGVYAPEGQRTEMYVATLADEFRQLVRELDDSKRDLRHYREKLHELKQQKETAETILSTKQAEEQRFAQTRALFTPEEALILYNGSHDVVIRLRGLTFPSGVAQLSHAHDSLLAKVTQALKLYPAAHIIVEGHTDNTGGAKLNVKLSQKRAQAVMDYLIESTGMPADKFKAVGYGAEKPVANNQTEHGRKENRRIDIVIVR